MRVWSNAVARVAFVAAAVVLAGLAVATAGAAVVAPADIAAGPDGRVWFTEPEVDRIGWVTPGGELRELSTGTNSGPRSITAGPDGNMWFTESGRCFERCVGGNRIGRVSPRGAITTFPVESRPASGDSLGLAGIAAGPDGNLWFTEAVADRIGRITPAGVVTEFSAGISGDAGPGAIVAGADGNLWFTEAVAGRIGRITPAGEVREFPVSVNWLMDVAAGADGNVWFTGGGGRIGRITPEGMFPTGLRAWFGPDAVAAGADGNIWFTGVIDGRIGRITPTGSVKLFRAPFGEPSDYIPTSSAIAAGPDGNVWFTEPVRGRIARITSTGVVSHIPPTPIIAGVGLRGASGVWVRLRCPSGAGSGCRGVVSVDAIRRYAQPLVRVAVGRYNIQPSRGAVLNLRLTSAGRRRLAGSGRLRVRISVAPRQVPVNLLTGRAGGAERITTLWHARTRTTLHTTAEALEFVRMIFAPYHHGNEPSPPPTLGDCFGEPDRPCPVGPIDSYMTPTLRDGLQRSAETGTGMEPVMCAQNTTDLITFEAPRRSGTTASIVVRTYWGGPPPYVAPLTLKVDLRNLILTDSSCLHPAATVPPVTG